MKRVVVTGGTGFIGRAVVTELRTRFPRAEIIPVGSGVVDIADEHAYFDWLAQTRAEGAIDHLIHLAALYKAGDWPVRHQSQWVERSGLMNYPDIIVAEAVAGPQGGAGLFLYSRSLFGWSDLGANRARVDRWLSALASAA